MDIKKNQAILCNFLRIHLKTCIFLNDICTLKVPKYYHFLEFILAILNKILGVFFLYIPHVLGDISRIALPIC